MTPTAARVIYPELPDPLTPSDLQQLFSPNFDERKWAPTVTRTVESQVALLVQLKIFQATVRFRRSADVPPAATDHVAHRMGVETGSNLIFPDRTLYRHRQAILKLLAPTGSRLSLQSRNAKHFYQLKQQLEVKNAGFRPNPGRPSTTLPL